MRTVQSEVQCVEPGIKGGRLNYVRGTGGVEKLSFRLEG